MKIKGIVAQGKKEANPYDFDHIMYYNFETELAKKKLEVQQRLHRHLVDIEQNKYMDQLQTGLQNGIYGVSSAVGNILGNDN